MSLIVLKLKRCVRRQCATGHVWCYLSQSILKQEIYKCVLKQLRQIHRTWAMSLTCPCCFKIIWYAEIRNVLIKRCLNLVKKRLQLRTHNRQRQITDISTIDVNKGVLSDKVLCNNGKDCRHIVGYQIDGALIPLFIKTPKNIFSYGKSHLVMMDFLKYKQEVKKIFVTCLGVTKPIINEQDIAVRTYKKVKYTLSKLYENKGRAWKSHQKHHHKVQRDYFWPR